MSAKKSYRSPSIINWRYNHKSGRGYWIGQHKNGKLWVMHINRRGNSPRDAFRHAVATRFFKYGR